MFSCWWVVPVRTTKVNYTVCMFTVLGSLRVKVVYNYKDI